MGNMDSSEPSPLKFYKEKFSKQLNGKYIIIQIFQFCKKKQFKVNEIPNIFSLSFHKHVLAELQQLESGTTEFIPELFLSIRTYSFRFFNSR
jgi:hypothetical protein